MLTGLAATAATALVGCSANTLLPADASGDSGSGTTSCGNNLCLDLNDAANAALTMVDGSLVVAAPTDRLIVIRTSMTELIALSDVCTHAGCGVRYDRVNKALTCPCHGSRYALTGAVTRGPANRALAVYPTQLDAATNVVTITL